MNIYGMLHVTDWKLQYRKKNSNFIISGYEHDVTHAQPHFDEIQKILHVQKFPWKK